MAQKGQLEVGVESAYAADEFTLAGLPGTDFTTTSWENALFLRYGLTRRLELLASAPHLSLETEQENATAKTSDSESGLGDVSLGIKAGGWKMAGFSWGTLLGFELPTGDSDKSLGQGFDVHPQALVTRRMGRWQGDVNAGYRLTGDYKVKGTKIEPADMVTYGVSGAYGWGNWTFLTEVRGESFGKEKQAGQSVANSDGSRFEVTPGLRWRKKSLKLKAGVDVSLGDESQRLYDWRAFVGISVLGRFSLRLTE